MVKINHQMDIIQILKQFRRNALLVMGLTTGYQRRFCQVASQQILSEYSTPTASSGDDVPPHRRKQKMMMRQMSGVST